MPCAIVTPQPCIIDMEPARLPRVRVTFRDGNPVPFARVRFGVTGTGTSTVRAMGIQRVEFDADANGQFSVPIYSGLRHSVLDVVSDQGDLKLAGPVVVTHETAADLIRIVVR